MYKNKISSTTNTRKSYFLLLHLSAFSAFLLLPFVCFYFFLSFVTLRALLFFSSSLLAATFNLLSSFSLCCHDSLFMSYSSSFLFKFNTIFISQINSFKLRSNRQSSTIICNCADEKKEIFSDFSIFWLKCEFNSQHDQLSAEPDSTAVR